MTQNEYHHHAITVSGLISLCSILLLSAEACFLKDSVIPSIAFWGTGGAAVLVGSAVIILDASFAMAEKRHERPLNILLIVQGALLAAEMIVGIVAAALI